MWLAGAPAGWSAAADDRRAEPGHGNCVSGSVGGPCQTGATNRTQTGANDDQGSLT